MILPVPSTIEGGLNTPKSISYLHNMYNVDGVAVSREPMNRYALGEITSAQVTSPPSTVPAVGVGRAMFIADGGFSAQRLMVVAGNNLYQIKTGGGIAGSQYLMKVSTTTIDTSGLDGGSVAVATGFTGTAMATGQGNYFFTKATDDLSELTDEHLPACRDVAYIGGRYVWLTMDGESIFWSASNDAGNIDSQSFFDAEASTDRNRALAVIGEDLYVFGAESIQRFRNIGAATQPFINVQNSIIPIGYLGGMIKLSTKVVFIGREAGGAMGVFEMSGSSINKISTPIIDQLLIGTLGISTGFSLDIGLLPFKADAKGQSFNSYGKTVYTFSFKPEGTTLYARQSSNGYEWGLLSSDTGAQYSESSDWYEKTIGAKTSNYNALFQFNYATFWNTGWYFLGGEDDQTTVFVKQDPESAQEFTDTNRVNTDSRISRGLVLGLRDANESDTVFNSLEVVYSRRTGSNYTTAVTGDINDDINLSVSLSGITSTWSTPETISFGDKDESVKLRFGFSGGITATNGTLAIALETDARTPFSIERLLANV